MMSCRNNTETALIPIRRKRRAVNNQSAAEHSCMNAAVTAVKSSIRQLFFEAAATAVLSVAQR